MWREIPDDHRKDFRISTLSYLLHVGMESSPVAAVAAASAANVAALTAATSPITVSTPQSILNFNDPLLLNHWYQLQLHRLQTEQYSIGLPHYLSQGMERLNDRGSELFFPDFSYLIRDL